MLFLVTKQQKDKILDEYYARLVYIFIISLLILFAVFMAILFPTYLTMKVDGKMLSDKIKPLENDVNLYKSEGGKKEALEINNNISILSLNVKKETVDIYKEIQSIYQEIPNVKISSISVDTLSKKVLVSADIDNKNTANLIVERLNHSRYKGAELPYSVFSQSKNFIFNLNLSYE